MKSAQLTGVFEEGLEAEEIESDFGRYLNGSVYL